MTEQLTTDGLRRSYRDLMVWQKAIDLVVLAYGIAATLPHSEQFGLCDQMRRCASSVPSNVAEGEGRRRPAEFSRFLAIAYGSLCELETLLVLCRRLGYGGEAELVAAEELTQHVGRMLNGLKRSLRTPTAARRLMPDA